MERDIVQRLREMAGPIEPNVCTEAAEAIERLRARVGQLEADASAFAERMTAELNKTRRNLCQALARCSDQAQPSSKRTWFYKTAEWFAEDRGWDCFKEDGK